TEGGMNVGVDGLDPSSIQLIGTAVTPAVMVAGCGILATGLDNQISRITARMRDMVREWRTLPEGHARRSLLREEVAIMDRRHAILARAIGSTYAALRLSRRAITLEGAELFRDGRPGGPPPP
ncbi:DUF2721 domain-containing protein, partial [Corallococcus sp. AB049A]